MDPHVEHAYLLEILNQCEAAVAAGTRMNTALVQHERAVVFFQHAQAFLVHAAALSRIFWPPPIRNAGRQATAQARADHLRHVFGIVVPHALQARDLRNHIEHFDERLDEWASTSTSFNLVDLNIMPLGAVAGVAPRDNFRQYDPVTLTFHFRGDAFNVQALATAVQETLERALARVAELERLR